MGNMCASCKKRFGLFTQANILCSNNLELCDDCFNKIKESYVNFMASYDSQKDDLRNKEQVLLNQLESLNLDDESRTHVTKWLDASVAEVEIEKKKKKESEALAAKQNEREKILSK